MPNPTVRSASLNVMLLGTAVALVGCSAVQSSKKLDTTPFAENTVSMAGEVQRYSRPPQWVYLSEFQDTPSVKSVRATAGELRRLIRSVALYSTQVVALHESRISEKRRVEELARYIDEVARPGIVSASSAEIGLTPEDYEATLARIRSRATLREALVAAQPLVSSVSRYADVLFDRADEDVVAAGVDLRERIDLKFGPMLENLRDLERVHMRTVKSFNLLYAIRQGEAVALAKLLEAAPEFREVFADREPSPARLDAAEERITGQLARIKAVREQLEPEFRLYENHERELEALRTQTEEMMRIGRLTLSVWSRSHRNLAAGIEVPPQIDLLKLITSMAKLGKETF